MTSPPPTTATPATPGSTVRDLLASAWLAAAGRRRLAVLVVTLPAVAGAVALAWPLLGRSLVDRLATADLGSADWQLPVAVAVGVLLLQLLLAGGGAWLTEVFRTGFRVDLQSRILGRLLRQPLRERDREASGWHVLEDAAALETVFADALPTLATCALQMALVFGVLLLWDPLVAVVALVGLPVTVLAAMLGGRALRHRSRRVAELAGAQMTHLVDTLDAGLLVRLAGAEQREADAFRAEADRLRDEQLALTRAGMWLALRDRLVAGALVLGMAAFVILRSADGALSIGELVATVVMLGMVSGPLSRLASLIRRLQPTLAAHDRLRPLLGRPVAEPAAAFVPASAASASSPVSSSDYPAGQLTLAAEGVHFRWREDTPVLTDVSLQVPPGAVTGLSGPTGAGKSTLALLLTGLLVPDGGRVTVNGTDLRGLDPASHLRAVTLVPQRDQLPGRTLRDALTWQAADADDDTIRALLDELGATTLVESLPDGLATPLRDRGGEFSGGQRQLLAIARALLARPRVLILDEATAALDEGTESRTLAVVREQLVPDGSVLLISHRASALGTADRRERLLAGPDMATSLDGETTGGASRRSDG